MILGVGIDIIEIERVQKSIDQYGDHFLKKIFTEKELEYCLSKSNKYQHLAARFAAKEAVYKALATEWRESLSWQSIEISNEPNGLPVVNLHGELKKFLTEEESLRISMSHSRDYVACVAIIYKKA
jgi:holo-[acyl-carrier protein] synthase